MQIEKLDDQGRRHLHSNGAQQEDENDYDKSLLLFFIIFLGLVLASTDKPFHQAPTTVGAKGPRARRQCLLTSSERKTFTGILQILRAWALRFIALIKEQLNHNTITRDALRNINFFVHQFEDALAIPPKACKRPGPETTRHTAGL
uniref:Uncharacterized protein n=1 Tax=Romanomermis culicivorax TaxID=13658 RepID=A0A915IEH9_ROMCU